MRQLGPRRGDLGGRACEEPCARLRLRLRLRVRVIARPLQLRVDGVLGVLEVFVVVLGREELGAGPQADG